MHMAGNGGTCHTVCALWIPELGLVDQGRGSEASAASSYQVA